MRNVSIEDDRISFVESEHLDGDVDFVKNKETSIGDVMLTDLITIEEGSSLEDAYEILKESKRSRLPVVDKNFNLKSLICRKDLANRREYPNASRNRITNQFK